MRPLPPAAGSTRVLVVGALLLPAGPQVSHGTRKMAGRLRHLAEATDTRRISFIHNRRAESVWRRYLDERNTETRLDLAVWAGVEALNAGATERAIQYLLEFRELAEVAGVPKTAPRLRAGRDRLALAYLRLGEQENCLAHHGADSCLMPIRGSGLHRATRGSRLALSEFGALLRDYPDDLRYRWLYNLAAMTLGKYPDGVPAEWRIPASAFDSAVAFPRFRDVATEAGVAVNGLSAGGLLYRVLFELPGRRGGPRPGSVD